MNIRDLRYFVAVAETGHFGQAAERCFVSQPTLSGQIRKLEDELGVSLFERTNRSVMITPAGQATLVIARNILDQVEDLKRVAQSHQDPFAGPFKLGVIPTLSPYLIPYLLKQLKKAYPGLELILVEDLTAELEHKLTQHEIDAALLATPVTSHELLATELFDEPFWIAYPRKHRFYHLDKITLKELKKETLLILAEGHCLAEQASQIFKLSSRQQSTLPGLQATSLETLIQLVRADYGVTLVPALAMRGSWTTGSGVVAQPLRINNARRRVVLASRNSFARPQVLDGLADLIRQSLPNTVEIL